MNTNKDLECSICNKTYSCKSSLSNHKRCIHGIRKHNTKKHYNCKFCNKEYAFQQSRWKHEQNCNRRFEENNTPNILVIPDPIKNEIEKMKEESEKQKQQIVELQNKLLTAKRLDTKTFKAVNKILMDRSYRNSQNNNVNSNNVINHNYQIFSLGNEELINVLTMQQKKQIMNSRLGSLEKIVEITHCGEMNQFKNIIITNLKDNYAYRYDDKKGYFVTVAKNILLDDVVTHRVTDIEAIYDELQTANKIDAKTKKLIQDFLDKMSNEDAPFFDNETKYDNFKSYKINSVKILLYNNQDKITKDIALLISDVVEETPTPVSIPLQTVTTEPILTDTIEHQIIP